MALEAAEQIANMMVMTPYPGFEGTVFHDALPQRRAQAGAEAAPADVDGLHQPRHDQDRGQQRRSARSPSPSSIPAEARTWAEIYYDIIKSDACVPLGHTRQRQHRHGVGLLGARGPRRGDAARPGGLRVLPLRDQRAGGATTPCPAAPRCGASSRQPRGDAHRARSSPRPSASARNAAGIGTPDDIRDARARVRGGRRRPGDLPAAGRPQQPRPHLRVAGAVRRRGDAGVQGRGAAREARKAEELAPYIAAALARKKWMPPLADDEIPVIKASVDRAQFARGAPPAGSQAPAGKEPKVQTG